MVFAIRLLTLMFLLSITSISFANETVQVANGEWLPYHSEKAAHYGAGSRIVTEAFALEGIKVKWKFFPWQRGYMYTIYGKVNASIGWIKTPKREKEVLFSDPVYAGNGFSFI